MTSPSAGRPSWTATHYQVLDLDPALLHSAEPHDAAILIKRAYRRALLRHHPDKSSSSSSPSSTTTTPQLRSSAVFTIDQISSAYAVLSSPPKRQEYDAALRLARSSNADDGQDGKFQTGIENVDLDDLEFDEGQEKWYRSCRCGNDRGYAFAEEDLVEASEEGVLMVGCQDCSLWLKVHFAMLEDDE